MTFSAMSSRQLLVTLLRPPTRSPLTHAARITAYFLNRATAYATSAAAAPSQPPETPSVAGSHDRKITDEFTGKGQRFLSTGSPITVPVGRATLGHIINVIGEPIDHRGEIDLEALYRASPPTNDLDGSAMETGTDLGSLLKILPPVDFCCVYGSSLHPNNNDKSSMEDYILGVSNPQQWHSENLKVNRDHYASWMASLGGAKLITSVAERIGVGVHFNPFVSWNDKMYKYGVVRMDDLVEDMMSWKRFYLSGRLQKPVRIIVDHKDITNTNLINLRAASSAALLLLPSKFTERELYAKICSLSYMGDLRMLFAEDKNKVKKIVEGQFELFRNMYKPLVEEYATKQLLKLSSCGDHQMSISQDCSLSATSSIVSYLPKSVRSQMGMEARDTKAGQNSKLTIESRGEAAALMQKVLRHRVMISSARQAMAGFIAVGAVHGVKYLGKKMMKAWKSSSK